jgi:hypothetical protein
MRRVPILVLCISLSVLGGCDVMNYIRQHVVGHGYNQVTMDAIQGVERSMTAATLPVGALGQNSVVLYRTRHGYYGKLSVESLAGSTLEFQFITFDAMGQVLAAGERMAMHPGDWCDLESVATDQSASGGAVQSISGGAAAAGANFLWTGSALVPQGSPPARFYLLP